jgi:ABC-type branched-subunit amino acid transport system substrate-binding protein
MVFPKRRFWWWCAATALVSFLTNVLVPERCLAETGVTDTEIVLGTANALSGPLVYFGTYTNMGINCYVNMVNDRGGILGRKLRVISEDDQYEPAGAIAAFTKLQEKGPFVLSGFCGSACMAKYVQMCQSNKVPAVGFYSAPEFMTEPTKRYLFAVRISNQEEERQFVQHMWNDCKFRKIGILYQNDAYGASHLQGLQEQLTKLGANVTGLASYTRKTEQIGDAYKVVKSADPQVVSLACVQQTELDVVRLAKKDGWHPLFFINASALVDAFLDNCGADGDGILVGMCAPPPSRTDLPLVAEFERAMKKYYPNETPRLMALQGFIDAMTICEGLKRAGRDLTREKFADALEGIHNLDVGLGSKMHLNYSKTDHVGFHNLDFAVIKNSKLVSVKSWKDIRANH